MTRFFNKVRAGSDWDHKVSLQEKYGTKEDAYIPFRGDLTHEYFHDIWSNVHYGYVGRAAGLQERLNAAGTALPEASQASRKSKLTNGSPDGDAQASQAARPMSATAAWT